MKSDANHITTVDPKVARTAHKHICMWEPIKNETKA